jgi:hypothetical protein
MDRPSNYKHMDLKTHWVKTSEQVGFYGNKLANSKQ